MPKIGRIDVPYTLYEVMLELSAKVTINNDLEQVCEGAGIKEEDMDEALNQLEIPDPPLGDNCDNCVISLIRMQTNDFLSNDDVIRHGEDFRVIEKHISQQAIQMVQNILSSDKQLDAIRSLVYSQPHTTMSRHTSPRS